MNPGLIETCVAALEEDAKFMDLEQREQFVALLPLLSKLYRRDSAHKGILIVSDAEGQTLIRINTTEYEAHGLLHNALPFHDELLQAQRPDEGRLN